METFQPIFRNPHLSTIAGNFWPRNLNTARFPESRHFIRTEPDVQVLVVTQQPDRTPRGRLVLVHGLEGSSDAGYKRSMAQEALEAGFIVHRFNMRSCGGTEHLALSNYHAGQTSDLRAFLESLEPGLPTLIGGFSLGGNVVLKLAGELGATRLIAGVCAVSTPIDLAACVVRLGQPQNVIYARRFLSRLKDRIRLRARQAPQMYDASHLDRVRTVYDFDDLYTARLFGFGTADRYYATQAAKNFLAGIRVPALIVQAQDDPLIPFEVYDQPAFRENPSLKLVAPQHGGHLGFLSRVGHRFWLDPLVTRWATSVVESYPN